MPAPALLRLDALAALGGPPASFTLAAGECLPLLGPSGSGKSRLLRAIADLDPHQGSCVLDEQTQDALDGPAWRALVGYVPADSGWWADTVAEHFLSAPWLTGQAPRLALAPACAGWDVARLSTGERQRLALLRAIERGPRVLLLDEPTSGLDHTTQLKVEAVLHDWLAPGGRAALVVTHSEDQAARLNPRRCLWLGPDAVEEGLPETLPR